MRKLVLASSFVLIHSFAFCQGNAFQFDLLRIDASECDSTSYVLKIGVKNTSASPDCFFDYFSLYDNPEPWNLKIFRQELYDNACGRQTAAVVFENQNGRQIKLDYTSHSPLNDISILGRNEQFDDLIEEKFGVEDDQNDSLRRTKEFRQLLKKICLDPGDSTVIELPVFKYYLNKVMIDYGTRNVFMKLYYSDERNSFYMVTNSFWEMSQRWRWKLKGNIFNPSPFIQFR